MARLAGNAGAALMEDAAIVDLYWARDESAIAQTKRKYGTYCTSIARRILSSAQDAEECVNDTYLGAWHAMPPHRPQVLSTFLGKITRNLSLKRYRTLSAQKRGGGEVELALDELAECLAAPDSVEASVEATELAAMIDTFLADLSVEERKVFVCRYWYCESIEDIAQRFGFGQSKVKMMLKRTRDRLAVYLEERGVRI